MEAVCGRRRLRLAPGAGAVGAGAGAGEPSEGVRFHSLPAGPCEGRGAHVSVFAAQKHAHERGDAAAHAVAREDELVPASKGPELERWS